MREHPSDRVDLRSDTVTQPTAEMREAMAQAVVGDDVLGDDPTVTELENRMATLLGKEAGLFVSSGTMSNAVAIRTHTQPGDEIVTESTSHIYVYEGGGYAAISGCSIALVEGESGIMNPKHVKDAIRKADGSQSHYPDGRLVCVENTSNRGGGSCYPQATLDTIATIAAENACISHIDGARLFNAAVATGTAPSRMAQEYDSISICISKGLGAPVGGVLIGSHEFIARAHRWRKMFGGGMRQAGILAAACLYALDNNIERLEDDHRRTKMLAQAIQNVDGFEVDMDTVETNMVYFQSEIPATQVMEKLQTTGIDVMDIQPHACRIVVHLHITDEDVQRIIEAFATL